LLYYRFFLLQELNENATLDRICCLALDDFLLYRVVLCFRINGDSNCPCSLVLRLICCKHVKELVFELLSHPVWGEKRCKIIAIFDTDQIFWELFLPQVINSLSKIGNKILSIKLLSTKKFFLKKMLFLLDSPKKAKNRLKNGIMIHTSQMAKKVVVGPLPTTTP